LFSLDIRHWAETKAAGAYSGEYSPAPLFRAGKTLLLNAFERLCTVIADRKIAAYSGGHQQ